MRAILAVLAAAPALMAHDAKAQEIEEQQFLFLLDPAYVQDSGAWQAGVGIAFAPENDSGIELDAEIEYGLTDSLQIQASLPYADGDVGDLRLGFSYGLARESGRAPALSVAIDAIAPTSDAGPGGWGLAVSMALTKQIRSGLFGHANLGFEGIEADSDGADEVDTEQWTIGVGAGARVSENATLTLELVREREEQHGAIANETEYTTNAALGLSFKPAEGFEIGVGAVTAFDGDDNTTTASLRALFEW